MPITILSPQKLTLDIAKRLAKQYQENFISSDSLSNTDNESANRLTLVAHSIEETFDNRSPNELATYLIETCKLPTTIKTIDLIGCEAGFHKKTNASFALKFAAELARMGRNNISVKTLTNIGFRSDAKEISVTVNLSVEDKVTFRIIAILTDEKLHQNKIINKQINELNNQVRTIDHLLTSLSSLKKLIDIEKEDVEIKKKAEGKVGKILEDYHQFFSDLDQEATSRLLEADDISLKISVIIDVLEKRKIDIEKNLVNLNLAENGLWNILYSTNDIRKSLDDNVNFSCSSDEASNLIENQNALEQLKKQEASSEEIQLIEEKIQKLAIQIFPGLEKAELRQFAVKKINEQLGWKLDTEEEKALNDLKEQIIGFHQCSQSLQEILEGANKNHSSKKIKSLLKDINKQIQQPEIVTASPQGARKCLLS